MRGGLRPALADRRREVRDEITVEIRIVEPRRSEQHALKRDLRVREQHRELGTREPEELAPPCTQCLAVRQRLEHAVEEAVGLELRHVVAKLDESRPAAALIEAQRPRLAPVVLEHVSDRVSLHLLEDAVPLCHRERARLEQRAKENLEVDLVVREIDAARVVDRVGVQANTTHRCLDPRALREAEIAALADDLRAKLRRGEPHLIVRAFVSVLART
jgi:hypothetical protein